MKYFLERRLDEITTDSVGLLVNANGISFYNEGNTLVKIGQNDVFRLLSNGETLVWSSSGPDVKDVTSFNITFEGTGTKKLVVTREIISIA